jgi:hypothetical protein
MGLRALFRLSTPAWAMLAFVGADARDCDFDWPDFNNGECPTVDDCRGDIEVGDDGCARCVEYDCRADGCVDSTCTQVDCGVGFYCDETQGYVQCLRVITDGCNTDEDCGFGGTCVEYCGADPSCPMCDVCLMQRACEYNAGDCYDDNDCEQGETCSFDDARAAPPSDDDPQAQAPPGRCVPAAEPSCDDVVCEEGFACVVVDGGVSCEGGPSEVTCTSTPECGAGNVCTVDFGDCRSDCPDDGLACPDVCSGVCVPSIPCSDNSECAVDESCVELVVCPECVYAEPACDAACLVEQACRPNSP